MALLFVLTNPSLSSFKEYKGLDPKHASDYVRRDINLFLFSVYEDRVERGKYIGVFGNFIGLSKSVDMERASADSSRIADSTHASWVADSTERLIQSINEAPAYDEYGILKKTKDTVDPFAKFGGRKITPLPKGVEKSK